MKLINFPAVLRIQSNILLIETILLLFCIPVGIIYNESLMPFLFSSLTTVFMSVILFVSSSKVDITKVTQKDGYFSVALSWIVFSVMGALPFIFSGTLKSFTDAFFETASGVTTTGASVFTDVEILPKSILFWRGLTHWIGGLGIIVLVIIILPSFGISKYSIFSMESSLKEKFHPKTKSIGLRLLYIYLGLTITETILLSIGDMNVFESICHTFGTVATGGFSTRNASIGAFSDYSQFIVLLFMFLSGISFVVYYYLLKMNFRKLKNNEELWFYIAVCLLAGSVVVSILMAQAGLTFYKALKEGLFQVVSLLTTTGYSTADYLKWPKPCLVFVFLLFFTGASSGSTTGNIKMVRHLIVLKNIKDVFKKLIHPNVVSQIRLNGKVLEQEINTTIISFVVLYLFVFLVSSLILSMAGGKDLLTSASAAASALGNIGPGLGSIGPAYNYSHFTPFTKIILSFLMIFGRLELLTFMVLFTPAFWKK
ncbi:MAG: TrkH family potassium uptake protein [Bacteroidales bacterium]